MWDRRRQNNQNWGHCWFMSIHVHGGLSHTTRRTNICSYTCACSRDFQRSVLQFPGQQLNQISFVYTWTRTKISHSFTNHTNGVRQQSWASVNHTFSSPWSLHPSLTRSHPSASSCFCLRSSRGLASPNTKYPERVPGEPWSVQPNIISSCRLSDFTWFCAATFMGLAEGT